MRFELTKAPQDFSVNEDHSFAKLTRLLTSLGKKEVFQLWMFRTDGEMACVLANENRAMVSILSLERDDILSLDGEYRGEGIERIYLENGQLDEMARAHCIEREVAINAGLHYFQFGVPAPFATWFESAPSGASREGIMLFTIEDVLEISGRGCVVVPGIPPPSTKMPVFRRGTPIQLHRPDGSKVPTMIRDVEMISRRPPNSCVPILLPSSVTKADVPIGTEVWYSFVGDETFASNSV